MLRDVPAGTYSIKFSADGYIDADLVFTLLENGAYHFEPREKPILIEQSDSSISLQLTSFSIIFPNHNDFFLISGPIYDTWLNGEESAETDHLKIYHSNNTEKGFFINLRDTIINIKNDNSLNISNPNTDSIVLTNEGLLTITLTV